MNCSFLNFTSSLEELSFIGRFVAADTFVSLDELCVSSIKLGARSIIRPDERSFIVRRSSRTTKGSSSRQIMRLVSVVTVETHKQTSNKWLPKFVQADNASSSIKTANAAIFATDEMFFLQLRCQRELFRRKRLLTAYLNQL